MLWENRLSFHNLLSISGGKKVENYWEISKYGKAGAALIETPAHTCRFTQAYSSWSCSPAELHYASDCGCKGTK